MTTIAHSVLAGTEVHEPKGVASASLGQVYVADGNGSGNWAGIGTSSFTGMIADFVWPVVQDGWLELDGTDINTTTYSALYDVMTIQMSGTRVSGTNTITSLSSTSNMKVGFYVFGTGIASGTTITAINSGTQITLSNNAGSSGTATVIVSPWLLNTGTIRLPDVSSAGRFRRSRTSTTAVGQLQASANLAHTHDVSGNTAIESNGHQHQVNGTTTIESNDHTHSYSRANLASATNGGGLSTLDNNSTTQTNGQSDHHTHSFSVTSGDRDTHHTHTLTGTAASAGGTESRPVSLVVMTCVKT